MQNGGEGLGAGYTGFQIATWYNLVRTSVSLVHKLSVSNQKSILTYNYTEVCVYRSV